MEIHSGDFLNKDPHIYIYIEDLGLLYSSFFFRFALWKVENHEQKAKTTSKPMGHGVHSYVGFLATRYYRGISLEADTASSCAGK